MELSFETKLKLGFIGNLLIVALSGSVFIIRSYLQPDVAVGETLDIVILSLIGISIVLLVVVYFIIRFQLDEKKRSQQALMDNKLLLQSILDNTNSPMSIKRLNGEYMLINRESEKLMHIPVEEAIGKTDHDLYPKEQADELRNADLEVMKAARELKIEEKYLLEDGKHTFLSVKFPLFDSKGRVYAIGTISTDITDRKGTEESIREADNFFKMSLDILLVANDQWFLKFNPALSKILGYTPAELSEANFFTFMLPDDIEISKNAIIKLQEGEKLINFENRWVCKDGSIKTLNWKAQADTTTGLIYALGHDVTAKKEMEKKLIMANQFFDGSFDIMFVAEKLNFIKVNPAFTKELGYDAVDIIGRPIFDILPEEYHAIATERVKNLMKGNPSTSFVYKVKCKDGTIKLIEVVTTADPTRGVIYTVGRNVTERVGNEETLKIADQFFNMSFDMLVVAKGEYFIKVNNAFTRILGYDKKDMADRPFLSFAHPDDREASTKAIKDLFTSKSLVNHRARARCKDGSYKWLEWTSTIDTESGLIYAVARDITEQVKLEAGRQLAINELMANEEKLELILENINEGVIVTNEKKDVILANYVANEMFGVHNNDRISANLTDQYQLYFPDEKTVFPSQMLPLEKALNGEPTDDVDIILWHPENREKRRVLMSGRPLVNPENKVVAAVITVKDISRYKQLEEELHETEQKYRRLIGFKKDQGEDVPEAKFASRIIKGKLPQ